MDKKHLPFSSDCPGDSVSSDPSVFSSFSSLGAKHGDNCEPCYVKMHTHMQIYGLVLCCQQPKFLHIGIMVKSWSMKGWWFGPVERDSNRVQIIRYGGTQFFVHA